MKKELRKKSNLVSGAKKFRQEKRKRDEARRLRKEAKKSKALQFSKNKSKKHTEIPNMFPFKQELIHELERKKESEKQKRQLEILKKKEQKENQDIQQLVISAQSRQLLFDSNSNQVLEISKKHGREIQQVIESADVLLEVLDIRDPEQYRSEELESSVVGQKKKLVIILNKIDLVPPQIAYQWLLHFKTMYPTILFKSNTQKQQTHLYSKSVFTKSMSENPELAQNILNQSGAVGTEALMSLLKNYCRDRGNISVGVVGYPNTGKSSIINSLKRQKAVGVSNTPGYTKYVQEVEIDSKVKLLDTPGIIFDKDFNQNDSNFVLRNIVSIQYLKDIYTPIQAILEKIDKLTLLKKYEIADYNDIMEFLGNIGRRRGKFKKHGVPDFEAAAKIVLHDWVTGGISYYKLPPSSMEVEMPAQPIS